LYLPKNISFKASTFGKGQEKELNHGSLRPFQGITRTFSIHERIGIILDIGSINELTGEDCYVVPFRRSSGAVFQFNKNVKFTS